MLAAAAVQQKSTYLVTKKSRVQIPPGAGFSLFFLSLYLSSVTPQAGAKLQIFHKGCLAEQHGLNQT